MAVPAVAVVALCVLTLAAGKALDVSAVQPVEDVDNSLKDDAKDVTEDIVYKMFSSKCSALYSPSCLKLDLARLVDRLSGSPAAFTLLPGVSLAARPGAAAAPGDSRAALHSLDDLLRAKVARYLRSLTVSVQLAEATRAVATNTISDEGRKRKGGNQMMLAGLFGGGTLMAVGLASLAGMAGKALMTSLLALVLAGLAALRGSGGGDHKSTTYEIITKPIVSHHNTHSSEVQHETHGGHQHAYAYGRSMDFLPVLPAGIVAGPLGNPIDTEDSYNLAYKALKPKVEEPLGTPNEEQDSYRLAHKETQPDVETDKKETVRK